MHLLCVLNMGKEEEGLLLSLCNLRDAAASSSTLHVGANTSLPGA